MTSQRNKSSLKHAPELLDELEYAAGLLDIYLPSDGTATEERNCLESMLGVIAKAKGSGA